MDDTGRKHTMQSEKDRLLHALDAARATLWQALDALSADRNVNEGWTKRDFYAHLAGWDAMVYTVLRDFLSGQPHTHEPYTNVDDANASYVATRQSTTEASARLESEINHFAVRTLLERIPAADYGASVSFPWGDETVISFIEGAVKHELGHAGEIQSLTATNQPDA
jgi:hypothetical protein